jgi:hypothetical protein
MSDVPVNPYAAPTVGPVSAPALSQAELLDALTPVHADQLLSLSRRIRILGVCAGIVAGLKWIACIYVAAMNRNPDTWAQVIASSAISATCMTLTAVACWWRPPLARWIAISGGILLALSILQPNFWTIPIVIIAIVGLIALFKGRRLYGAGRIHHETLASVVCQKSQA